MILNDSKLFLFTLPNYAHMDNLMSSNELDMYRQIDRHIGQNSSNNWYILTLPEILCWKNVSDFFISFYIMLKKWLKVPKKMTNFFNKSTLTDFTHISQGMNYVLISLKVLKSSKYYIKECNKVIDHYNMLLYTSFFN